MIYSVRTRGFAPAPCGLALRDALAYYILPVGHSEWVGSVAGGGDYRKRH